MAQLADTIGHAISMISRQPRHPRNFCPEATETVPSSRQRMSDGEWRDSRLLVAPGAFRGTRFVLYVAADAAEMVNMSYAWLVQISWIEGGAMALVAWRRPGATTVVADGAIASNALMQLVAKVGWSIHLHQNR